MASFSDISKQWKNAKDEPKWCEDKSCKGTVELAKRLYYEDKQKKEE